MDIRRFLRYVVPGLLFATEAVLLLSLLRPDVALAQLNALKSAEGLGAVFTALLASGGVGFFLSTLHHMSHWWRWHPRPTVVDHSGLLRDLEASRVVVFRRVDSLERLAADSISREDAWILVTSLWHARRESSPIIKAADAAAASLADMVHATGAARVSAVVAPVVAFTVAGAISEPSYSLWSVVRFAIAAILAVGIVCVSWTNHRRTGRFAQSTIDLILAQALRTEQLSQQDTSEPLQVLGLPTMNLWTPSVHPACEAVPTPPATSKAI